MLDEQTAASNKRDFGYASMGPRRKRLAVAIACVSLVCLGAGVAAGVLIERSFHSGGHQPACASSAAFVAPSSASNNSAPTNNSIASASRPTILLVGDVHTQLGSDVDGWATRLQSLYVRSVDVVNRGLVEFNTERFVETALQVVSKELTTAFSPVLITIWFGTNDAALTDGPDARDHVRVERYYDNLVHILRTLRKRAPQTKLLVVSPPVVDDDARRSEIIVKHGDTSDSAIDRTNNATAAYATACGEAAKALRDDNIAFLDLYAYLATAYANTTARATLFRDGLRFSAEGQRVAFEQVNGRIRQLLPAVALDGFQIPTPSTIVAGH